LRRIWCFTHIFGEEEFAGGGWDGRDGGLRRLHARGTGHGDKGGGRLLRRGGHGGSCVLRRLLLFLELLLVAQRAHVVGGGRAVEAAAGAAQRGLRRLHLFRFAFHEGGLCSRLASHPAFCCLFHPKAAECVVLCPRKQLESSETQRKPHVSLHKFSNASGQVQQNSHLMRA